MMHHASRRLICSGSLCLCLCAPARADRAAVEQSLKDMGAAAAAANVDGYLSHIARTDPLFFKEQENWAKDLRRKTPATVAFTIAAPKDNEDGEKVEVGTPPEFGDARARFEMVTTWKMPGAKEGDKGERSVSYPVVFVRGDAGKWLFAGEDWLTMESGGEPPAPADVSHHNEAADAAEGKGQESKKADDLETRPRDVRFQGPVGMGETGVVGSCRAAAPEHRARVRYFAGYEQVARKIVEVLPLVRGHVDEGFGGEVPRVQEVKLYPTMRHLQESIYLSYVDGLSGWNEPGEAIKLLTRPTAGKRGLRSLLAHEYGHVATFELGAKANDMPWWVLEGVAELSSERFGSVGKDAENMVVRWQGKDALAKWDDLADFHTVQESSPPDLQAKVYKQGHHMLMYISDRWGKDGRNAWLRAMSGGNTIDEATRAATGMGWDELDAAWRGRVKEIAAEAAQKKAREEKQDEKP